MTAAATVALAFGITLALLAIDAASVVRARRAVRRQRAQGSQA